MPFGALAGTLSPGVPSPYPLPQGRGDVGVSGYRSHAFSPRGEGARRADEGAADAGLSLFQHERLSCAQRLARAGSL
ncbi:hypothetical protein F2982_02925 [Rhizobium sp. BG4]|nr:hypothetical protein F2982_02925 [Rhizobium sp. BG4]